MTLDFLLDFYKCHPINICIDSRYLKKGDLFFALKGARVDGHDFVLAALTNGAKAAVVDLNFYIQACQCIPESKAMLIPVVNPLQALQSLAKNKMAGFRGKTIAVTGSVGKTTTKDFLKQLLTSNFHVAVSPGNSNSQIGLPLAILNHMPEVTEIVVVEMGMSCAGEIEKLIDIAPPDIAILTAVTFAHAENFASLEGIALAKSEIFSHVKTKLAIINKSICDYANISSKLTYEVISFAPNGCGADFSFALDKNLTIYHEDKVFATFSKPNFLGNHNCQNLLAAIVAALKLGIGINTIDEQLKNCILPKKRLQIKSKNGITFIDDSYNATSLSMKAAIDVLIEISAPGSKIAVLGEMKELGDFSKECHYDVAVYALQNVDFTIFVGQAFEFAKNLSKEMNKPWLIASSLVEVVLLLSKLSKAGDAVLLKGSNLANLGMAYEML